MGGGGSTTNTVQQANPWVGQQPYLSQILQQAQGLYGNKAGYPQPYPGSTTVAPNPAQVQAQQLATSAATGPQTDIATNAANAANFDLGAVLYPQSNPALQGAIQGAIDPAVRNFQQTIIPGIRSDAQLAGQPGGTRQGIAEGNATEVLNQQILDTAAQMENANYQAGLQAQGRALALAPQTQAAQVTPATTIGAVGGQQSAYEQALLNQAITNWNYQQQQPYQQLGQYLNFVEGNYGGASSAQATGEQGLTSQLQSILGTGLMGAALYPSVAGMFGGGASSAAPFATIDFAGLGAGGAAAAGAGMSAADVAAMAPLFM